MAGVAHLKHLLLSRYRHLNYTVHGYSDRCSCHPSINLHHTHSGDEDHSRHYCCLQHNKSVSSSCLRLPFELTNAKLSPNPTAAVNLDFETGDDYNWAFSSSSALYTKQVVSPGHSRSGVTSNFAATISRNPGTTPYYTYAAFQQPLPFLDYGQTYRFEVSIKYDVDSLDDCAITFSLWGQGGVVVSFSNQSQVVCVLTIT